MAANNLSNRRHKGDGRKHRSGGKHHKQEKGHTMSQMRDQVAEYYERGSSQIRDMTRDREGAAVLIALAAGFGVGLLVGAAMAPHPKPRRWTDRLAAEGLGRRLMERIEGIIPDMITERLGR
jgi:hypothetical protein